MGNLEKVVKLIKNKCWGNKSQEEYLEKITRMKKISVFLLLKEDLHIKMSLFMFGFEQYNY